MRPHQALEYKENYPNNILVESDMAENGKYAAICYRLKDGSIYRTMGTTAYVFDTAQEAINEMHEAITEYIKEFSTNTEEQPMDAQAKDWREIADLNQEMNMLREKQRVLREAYIKKYSPLKFGDLVTYNKEDGQEDQEVYTITSVTTHYYERNGDIWVVAQSEHGGQWYLTADNFTRAN